MKKIVIDPITRIEGHFRAEVEIDEEWYRKRSLCQRTTFSRY